MQGSENAGGVPRNKARVCLLVGLAPVWALAFGCTNLAHATQAPANPVPAAAQGLPLRLNLPEGFTWTAGLMAETSCVTDWDSEEPLTFRRQRNVVFRCRVKEKRADGNMSVEFQYVRIRDVPHYGGLMSAYPYDINDPTVEDKSPEKSYRKKALRALCWRTFVAEVAPTGQVRRIEGFSRLYDELRGALAFDGELPRNIKIHKDKDLYRKEMEETSEKSIQEFFGGYWPLSEDRLKETVQQFFLVRPDKPISQGESWHTEEVSPGLALRCKNLWTFRKPRAALALVDLSSQVRMDLDLCEPNIPETHWPHEFDYLAGACS